MAINLNHEFLEPGSNAIRMIAAREFLKADCKLREIEEAEYYTYIFPNQQRVLVLTPEEFELEPIANYAKSYNANDDYFCLGTEFLIFHEYNYISSQI